jgi:hypothetical protein
MELVPTVTVSLAGFIPANIGTARPVRESLEGIRSG